MDKCVEISVCEYDRIIDENNALWAILKTCIGCKKLVPGIMYGCEIQQHIDLSGHCNQKEAE